METEAGKMANPTVEDMMVPVAEYATVSEEATLFEAVVALERAQRRFDESHYKHRAILVFGTGGRIVGKVSQLDVVRCLEPNARDADDFGAVQRFGFSPVFIRSTHETFGQWQKPLDDICDRSAFIMVKDIMYTPDEGEYVDENASLDAAIHLLVSGRHQSLLVTRKDDVVGILRLSDVFMEVCKAIKGCR
jgi:CBS domain-containing protein